MNYKTILVHLNESRHTYNRIKIAVDIAARFNAHLVGAAVTALPGAFYLPGVLGESNISLGAYLEFLREQATNALVEFEAMAGAAGLASFEVVLIEDESGGGISMKARYSDLVVVGQTDPDESLPALRSDFPEYVVMHAGRPVLILPYAGNFNRIGSRAVIAWNGSMEAARALSGAIPLLEQAEYVEVVVMHKNRRGGIDADRERPGSDAAHYLARHGIKATVSQPVVSLDIDMGNALLSHATDVGADLIVMGGYGHTRFREVLLGGVTQMVLKSMTIPILMSH